MASKRKKRTISHDALAIGHAMKCSIPALRRAAIDHVRAIVKEEHGSSSAIAGRLGIVLSTWWEWVQASPEIKKAHYGQRAENAAGPVPAALSD